LFQTIQGGLQSRNVTITGHRTSLRLESNTWSALEEICMREQMSIHEVCTRVEQLRDGSSRTAAVRAYVLLYFRVAASDIGHAAAGHGTLCEAKNKAENSSRRPAESQIRGVGL